MHIILIRAYIAVCDIQGSNGPSSYEQVKKTGSAVPSKVLLQKTVG